MADAFQHPPGAVDVKLLVRKYSRSGKVLVPVVAVFILGMDSRPGMPLAFGQYQNLLDALEHGDHRNQQVPPWTEMVDLEYTERQLIVFQSAHEGAVERDVQEALEAVSVRALHTYRQYR